LSAHIVKRLSGMLPPGSALRSGLALILTFLLVLAGTASVSHELHRSLHSDTAANNHLCLVCSLVAGHAAAADSIAIAVLFSAVLLCLRLATPSLVLPRPDYQVARGRAPPLRSVR
jgi:hypothetical protein